MADYVKRKIVEKLAKFTKDLKPADISLNFLTGKGELHNLELNAEYITEVLQLPPWIHISRVVCNTIRAHVPFTSLRNDPVHFSVDQVEIEVSTCTDEGPRKKNTELLDRLGSNTPSKYGYTEKVIDGMRVEIRSIIVRFHDPTFNATLEMTDIVIQSTTPAWKPASLPYTRMKNVEEESIVIYKMCSWNILKVEAQSTVKSIKDNRSVQTKLRLIASETQIKVALKRRITDCTILYTRISVHLGDVDWIASQSQLRAVSKLVQSFLGAAVKTAQSNRESREGSDSPEASPREVRKGGQKKGSALERSKKLGGGSSKRRPKVTPKERAFQQIMVDFREGKRNLPAYEVIQDSFHLRTGKVNLQLYDDTSEGVNESVAEGSVLIRLIELGVDLYFDQPAGSGRNHWNKANDLLINSVKWSRDLIEKASKNQVMDLPSVSLPDLHERGVVIRCAEFCVDALKYSHRSDDSILPVIMSDKKTFNIPEDYHNPAFQVAVTTYHYPDECGAKFLLPRPNVNIYFSPVHVNVHQKSCLWLAEFVHGVVQTINFDLALSVHDEGKSFVDSRKAKSVQVPQLPGIDVKFRILFVKVTIPVPKDLHIDDGRPKALQLETAAIDVNNFSLDTLLKEETFNSAINKFKTGWVFTSPQTQFPHFDGDLTAIPERLKEMLNYSLRKQISRQQGGSPMNAPYNSELVATEGWHIHTSCVHVAFVESYTHQATLYTKTFINDFPLHGWVFLPSENTASPLSPSSEQKEPTFSFIVHAPDIIHAELERLQLLFIMRLKDSFTEFKYSITKFLTLQSLELPAQEPVSSSEDLAEPGERLTTPTSSEEGAERERRGDAEREEGERRGDTEREEGEGRGDIEREEGEGRGDTEREEGEGRGDTERGSDTERTPSRSSNKLKDISASIGGCVIVQSIVADIMLPTLFTANNSRKATKLSIPEENVSPPETSTSEADIVLKNILPSHTPSPRVTPRVSPSGSQSSLTGSHASSSTVSSVTSLQVVSEPPPPPPHGLAYSHHYSSAVNVRVDPVAKMQHSRSLSTSNLPTVAYVAPSMLSSIPSPPGHSSPSPLSFVGMRAHSAHAETGSSTTAVRERKTSEDVTTSTSISARAETGSSTTAVRERKTSEHVTTSTSISARAETGSSTTAVQERKTSEHVTTSTSISARAETGSSTTAVQERKTSEDVTISTSISARAETSSSTAGVRVCKTSEDVTTSTSSSTLAAVNPQETDSSSLHSSTSDIPSSGKDGETLEGFVLVNSPSSVSSKSSFPPDPCHTDAQIQMPSNPITQVEPEEVVAGTERVAGSLMKEVGKTEQHEGVDSSGMLTPRPESSQNGSRSPSRASSRLSIGSKRAKSKSPSPIHAEPKHVLRIQVEHLCALPTVQASSNDITVRASAGHLRLLELEAKTFGESRSPFGNSRRSRRTEEDQNEESNPELKVRFELGNQVKRFFSNSDLKNIDAIVMAKIEGLVTGLLAPNGPLLKDFFTDEYETDDPIPIHLRFENTEITLKDELQHTADDWTSLTIHVDHANIRRGRKVEGADLFFGGERLEELGSSETLPCGEEETDSAQSNSNKELLQSFRSFIDTFEAHVNRHGERLILPRPDHVAGLLQQLQSSLVVEQQQVAATGAPPSYSEAISESRIRSQSIAVEIQRLRRENEDLRRSQSQNEHLVTELTRAKDEMDRQQSDFEMVTEECKRVKEQLVAYKQVIEKQQLQIEGLACGQNVDTRMLSAYHPPH